MKGTIKLSPLTNTGFKEGMEVIFKNQIINLIGDLITNEDLILQSRQLVIEYSYYTVIDTNLPGNPKTLDTYRALMNGDAIATKVKSQIKQLPIQASQWQEILDKGLVGKELEWKEWENYPSTDKIAHIELPSPKTYTEEETRKMSLAAFKEGLTWAHSKFTDNSYLRFNTWWLQNKDKQ